MGSFKSVRQQATLLEVAKPAEEADYWTTAFERIPFVRKEAAQVTNIAFTSDAKLPTFAVSCGTRVNVHNEPPEWNRAKALNVFPMPVYGGKFRHDGRLFVCACEDSVVRALDMSTATLLRQFKGHKLAVHGAAFSRDGLRVGSAGDDRTVRIWDLSVGEEVTCYREHTDYARRILSVPTDSSLWISAGYDKTVKLFDSRMQNSVRSIECPSLVEDIAINPSGMTLAVASDRSVSIWDMVTPSKSAMANLQHHHKTVTSLCFSEKGAFLLSASLDKHIKVFDMDAAANFSVVTTLDQSGPIVKMAISPEDRFLATATTDNRLTILSRQQKEAKPETTKVGGIKLSRYFERILNNVPVADVSSFGEDVGDNSILASKISVVNTKSKTLGGGTTAQYDRLLRRFEHSKALTNVMKDAFNRKNCDVAVSVIDELIRRDVLHVALAGRSEYWIAKALRFAGGQYQHGSFQRVLSEFVNAIADVHGDALVASDNVELRKAFRYVCEVVDTEWEASLEYNELAGAVECLLNQSQLAAE